jgi:CRP-like cAMP-binding protein
VAQQALTDCKVWEATYAKIEKFSEGNYEIELEIPQYHIASYLGIIPTQLSRIRKKMAG